MSYAIPNNLGLDRADTGSPDFLRMLERMQREAWESLQREDSPVRADADRQGAFAE